MGHEFDRFVEIIRRLRAPDGCPWDRKQTHRSILGCLLEETYEFIEAAREGNDAGMREELGDLLLQVVLHAQIARERGSFDMEAVAGEIARKIVRRHPHVFGDTAKLSSAEEVTRNWERIKSEEKGKAERCAVDGIPKALPALFRAERTQRRVAKVGFDWNDTAPVFDKVEEEFREWREALEQGANEAAEEELGDILFALVNVARHHDISAEEALQKTVNKFSRRFRYVTRRAREAGREPDSMSLEEMDVLWEESKRGEKRVPSPPPTEE